MGSTAPFLPAAEAGALHSPEEPADHGHARHESEYTTPPQTASQDLAVQQRPTSQYQPFEPQNNYMDPPAGMTARPMTSANISRNGTPPAIDTSARPATAPGKRGMDIEDDEPPSPVSPVSAVSPIGSRPTSADFGHRDHHDL
jgi:hypothetical protein